MTDDDRWRADQLTQAEQIAEPLRQRVSKLETELQDAVDRTDYSTAAKVQRELAKARIESEPAQVMVRELLAEVKRADDATARTVAVSQAHKRHTDMMKHADDAMRAAAQHLAQVAPAVATARAELQSAVSAERRAGQARRDALGALVAVGEVDPHMVLDLDRSYGQPTNVSAAIDRDRFLSLLHYGRIR